MCGLEEPNGWEEVVRVGGGGVTSMMVRVLRVGMGGT